MQRLVRCSTDGCAWSLHPNDTHCPNGHVQRKPIEHPHDINHEQELTALRAELASLKAAIEAWKVEESEWVRLERQYREALQRFVDQQPHAPPEGGWMLAHQRACVAARAVLEGRAASDPGAKKEDK